MKRSNIAWGKVWGVVLIGLIITGQYVLYTQVRTIRDVVVDMLDTRQRIDMLEDRVNDLPSVSTDDASAVGGVITSARGGWLDIQKRATNAVVQVFAQVSRFNWIEPYKTPEQGESRGSGFFITDEGYFVTNYHVIDEATNIEIQIPALGKQRLAVEIVGVSPDRDIALLKVSHPQEVREQLGEDIPFLALGSSDNLLRTQALLALGYPLGFETLKSTEGIVSGRQSTMGMPFVQITAPLNPGVSGGPVLDQSGKVVGINSAGVMSAQNTGYVIPISEVKAALNDLYKVRLLRKPILGALFTSSSRNLTKFLGNPGVGGWYVARSFEGSLIHRVGVKTGDMIYRINGYEIDPYGEISVPWSEDRVSVLDLLNRMVVGDDIHLLVYRSGERKDVNFTLKEVPLFPVRKMYPQFEHIDFEVLAGMVVMPLTLNHVIGLVNKAPFLMKYSKPDNQVEPKLIITHVLPNSPAHKSRTLIGASLIEEVNGEKITTLDQYRSAVKKSSKTGYVTIRVSDRELDRILVVFTVREIVDAEPRLASEFHYKISPLYNELQSYVDTVAKSA